MFCRFAISPALVAIAMVSAASAQPAPETSGLDAPPPTACQLRLTDHAVFRSLGDLAAPAHGPAGCGGPDAVLLQRVIVDDHTEVAIEPAATLRCEMAEAVTEFVRSDLAPAAAALGAPLTSIENFDSFNCRSRNRVAGARLSEHGLANALDIRSIRLKDGRVVLPAEAAAPLLFRTAMRTAACELFTTVLGPGSDGYHEDHVHFDRAERHNGFRLCQWDLRDEPRFALQSISNRPAAPPPATTAPTTQRGSIPMPRPRPATTRSNITLTGELRH